MIYLEQLLASYGYTPIPSNNPSMQSWKNDEKRVNRYFKTNTFQIQEFARKHDPGKILRNPTEEELEDFI